jgi:hypothetical protein
MNTYLNPLLVSIPQSLANTNTLQLRRLRCKRPQLRHFHTLHRCGSIHHHCGTMVQCLGRALHADDLGVYFGVDDACAVW